MPEPVAADFAGQSGSGVVAKVAVPAHDALLQRPWADGIFLQQFHVVVGFEHHHVYRAHSFDNELGRVAEVGQHADRVRAAVDGEADRVVGVVRNAERFDREVADFKWVAGREESPGCFRLAIELRIGGDGFGCEPVGVNGNRLRAAQNREATRVVAVFVREQNGVEVGSRATDGREPLCDLPAAQPGIDEDGSAFGFDECAVTGTAAAQNCDLDPHMDDSTRRVA